MYTYIPYRPHPLAVYGGWDCARNCCVLHLRSGKVRFGWLGWLVGWLVVWLVGWLVVFGTVFVVFDSPSLLPFSLIPPPSHYSSPSPFPPLPPTHYHLHTYLLPVLDVLCVPIVETTCLSTYHHCWPFTPLIPFSLFSATHHIYRQYDQGQWAAFCCDSDSGEMSDGDQHYTKHIPVCLFVAGVVVVTKYSTHSNILLTSYAKSCGVCVSMRHLFALLLCVCIHYVFGFSGGDDGR